MDAPFFDEAMFRRTRDSIPPARFATLLKLYAADMPRRVAALAAARDAHDTAAIRREAHSIIGLAGTLGAVGLAEAARALEAAAASAMPTDIDDRLRAIAALAERSQAEVQRLAP